MVSVSMMTVESSIWHYPRCGASSSGRGAHTIWTRARFLHERTEPCEGARAMSQISFADAKQAGKRKKTRREVPWRDGTGRAVEGAAQGHRAALPGGRPRASTVSARSHAPCALDAELVRAERPTFAPVSLELIASKSIGTRRGLCSRCAAWTEVCGMATAIFAFNNHRRRCKAPRGLEAGISMVLMPNARSSSTSASRGAPPPKSHSSVPVGARASTLSPSTITWGLMFPRFTASRNSLVVKMDMIHARRS